MVKIRMGALLLVALMVCAVSGATLKSRSIGTQATALFTATGKASTNGTRDTVTISSSTLPLNVGLGDSGTLGGQTIFVKSRVNDSTLALQAAIPTGVSNGNITLLRAFNTITAWEAGAPADLVGFDIVWQGVCYNDGVFAESRLVFGGSVTDNTHYKWLTVAEGQRHEGNMGTGARLVNSSASHGAIQFLDAYAQVDWLDISATSAAKASAWGIGTEVATGSGLIKLNHLILHDVFIGLYKLDNAPTYEVVLANSLIMKTVKHGVVGRSLAEAATVRCYNVSAVQAATDNDAPYSGFKWCYARNCISFYYGLKGFGNFSYLETDPASDYNISDDDKAPGTNSLKFMPPDVCFPPFVAAEMNLHLLSTSPAIGKGDSTGLSEYAVDIDGETRSAAWDIGADSYSEGAAVETAFLAGQSGDEAGLKVVSSNPFNPSVTLAVQLGQAKSGSLRIVSTSGKVVWSAKVTSSQQITWSGSRFASGIFFATLSTGNQTIARKIILQK